MMPSLSLLHPLSAFDHFIWSFACPSLICLIFLTSLLFSIDTSTCCYLDCREGELMGCWGPRVVNGERMRRERAGMRCKGWVADASELPGGWCCCDVALKNPSSQHFLKRIEDLHGRVTRTHSKGDGYHSFPGRGVRVVAKGKKIRHESSGKDFACHHYHAILFVTAVATTLAPLFVPSPYHSPFAITHSPFSSP